MKIIFAALLFVKISAASKLEVPKDYDNLVQSVFGTPPVCECVPYYQCNYNGTMNEDGADIIDIRAGFVGTEEKISTRQPCSNILDVCCYPIEVRPGAQSSQAGQAGEGDINSQDANGQSGNNGQGGTNGQGGGDNGKPYVSRGCGYRNFDEIGFRTTENYQNVANYAEFPWMVAVFQSQNVQGSMVKVYQCGGSLIHRRVILTAAHCVHGKSSSQLSIRAGEWDTQATDEPLPHQDREVDDVFTHPGYQKRNLHNDYALLVLTQPVDLAYNVEVVCLPEQNEVYDHIKCVATGWGKKDSGKKGQYQAILKAVDLPIIPHDQCQNSLRTAQLGKYFKLHKSFMCAGGFAGIDTCTGDGCSPLVCPLPEDPTRYTQAGIVAWGIGCGENNVPGVYADVTKGRRWIDEILATYNIDPISYSPRSNNK